MKKVACSAKKLSDHSISIGGRSLILDKNLSFLKDPLIPICVKRARSIRALTKLAEHNKMAEVLLLPQRIFFLSHSRVLLLDIFNSRTYVY